MGLAGITLFLTCALVVRNTRVVDAFQGRIADHERRAAAGLAPRTRKRRRRSIADLIDSA
jgi:hypothetical protein